MTLVINAHIFWNKLKKLCVRKTWNNEFFSFFLIKQMIAWSHHDRSSEYILRDYQLVGWNVNYIL